MPTEDFLQVLPGQSGKTAILETNITKVLKASVMSSLLTVIGFLI